MRLKIQIIKRFFCFKSFEKDIIMIEEYEDLKKIVDFVRKILNLMNLEIPTTYQVNIEYQLIANVILMLHRNKANLYLLFFIILVIMIVIYFLKRWFMIK